MAQDHNDIYSIVERLRVLEEGLTPTNVKHGLNRQQKSVDQLSATFRPKTVAVLSAKRDPKNPLAGKLVGGCEESINEAEMAEDVLEKVKNSFKDFIKQAEEEIKDSDIKEKKQEDSDLKKKERQDRDLVAKKQEVDEDESELSSALSGVIPAAQPAGEPGVSIKECAPIKTIALEDGRACEIHGDEQNGFEVRHSGRSLPTKFKDMDQAEMAIHMFNKRRQRHNDAQDYIEEK